MEARQEQVDNTAQDRDEALAKLVQYRRHVKRAREAMEAAVQTEKQAREEEVRKSNALRDRLSETDRSMTLLQQTCAKATRQSEVDKTSRRALESELIPLKQENDVLKKQLKRMESRMRSLANMEKQMGL